MFSKGFSKYSTMAFVSMFDNIDSSLLTNGMMNKNMREMSKNIASIVITADTASPRWNFLIWNFFKASHKGLPSIDKIMAIAKYTNMSGKKYINAAKANIPAIGFMKALILFIFNS